MSLVSISPLVPTSGTNVVKSLNSQNPVMTDELIQLPIDSEKLQLDDFVYSYPDQSDLQFQSKITAKKEFQDLRAPLREKIPEEGGFFKSQVVVDRFMQHYDELFLIARAGVGKTGSALGAAQHMKQASINAKIDIITRYYEANADYIKKVYILVRGEILIDTFMKQLICNFSMKDEYITQNVLDGKNTTVRKSRLKREINKYYEILTYSGFANKTVTAQQKSRTDDDLKREFSGCLFIIDEFHNLRVESSEEEEEAEYLIKEDSSIEGPLTPAVKNNSTFATQRKLSAITTTTTSTQSNNEVSLFNQRPTLTDSTTLTLEPVSTQGKVIPIVAIPGMQQRPGKKRKPALKRLQVYNQINRVLKVTNRRKVIAMTATPMINTVEELRSPLNLLLPADLQLPASLDLTTATLEDLEPYLRGRVSFVRESKSEVNVVYESLDKGPSISMELPVLSAVKSSKNTKRYSQTRLWKVPMMATFIDPDGKRRNGQDTYYASVIQEPQKFRLKERQASTAIFPDGSYDKIGHSRYIEQNTAEQTQKNPFRPTAEYQKYLQHYNSRRGMSAVLTNMIEIIDMSKGNSFVTTDFVNGASGVINIGMYFEASGWKIFTGAETVFVGTSGINNIDFRTRYCGGAKKKGLRRLNIPRWRYNEKTNRGFPAGTRDDGSYSGVTGPPRFAIISTYNKSYHEKILAAFNSPENMNGEIIRVLIVSQIGQEGINTANVINTFVPTAGWTASGTYQKIRRAIRATSHDDLIALEKEKARQAGTPVENVVVTVHIYLMAAIRANPTDGIATAEIVYYNAEVKDIEIKRVERILKQVSIDCHLHRERNMQPDDKPYSVDCDYMESCHYECYPPISGPISLDTSSYDLLYAGDVMNQISAEVREVFRTRSQLSFSLLYSLLSGYRHKLIDFTLERMITDRHPIIDRKGRRVYLEEEGNIIYLTNQLVSSQVVSSLVPTSDYTLSVYQNILQSTQTRSLADVISELATEEQNPIITALKQTCPTYTDEDENTIFNTEFTMLLDKLTVPNQIKLFEETTYKFYPYLSGNNFDRAVISYFADNFFQQDTDMSIRLQKQANIQSQQKVTSISTQRRVNTNDRPFNGKSDLRMDAYVHTLYDRVERGSSYAMMTQGAIRRIRILKMYYDNSGYLVNKEQWRDTNSYEYEVYKKMISDRIYNERAQMEQNGNGVYGIFSRTDKKFRIVDHRTDRSATGATCTDLTIIKLIELLWYLGEVPSHDFTKSFNREDLITQLTSMQPSLMREDIHNKQIYTHKRLKFYYNWLAKNNGRPQLCNIIYNIMSQKKIISTR